MKRIIAIVLMLAAFFASARAESYEQWILDKADAMMNDLGALIADDTYLQMYYSSDLMDELRSGFVVAPPTRYVAVYLKGDAETIREELFGPSVDISDVALRRLVDGLPETMATALPASVNEISVAFSAVFQVSECFPMPEGFVPLLVLIDTGADTGAILTAVRSGEGIVRLVLRGVPARALNSLGVIEMNYGDLFEARELIDQND